VLAAHNNHIMKTELDFGGGIGVLPMGLHLARMLGDDYRTLGVVHTADHVPRCTHSGGQGPAGMSEGAGWPWSAAVIASSR